MTDNFKYRSFNRPLWNGFNPGVVFEFKDITPDDSINGRKPYDVITTNTPITADVIKNLELTDYQAVAKRDECYKYAISIIPVKYLKTIQDMIKSNKLASIDDINTLVKKYPAYLTVV